VNAAPRLALVVGFAIVGAMALRVILITVLAGFFAAALWVFEAASATDIALNMALAAKSSDSPNVRIRLLDRAEQTLRRSWANPSGWHAGATEALSAIYLLKSEANANPALAEQSVRWAVRTIRLAPVQPHAWTRLAVLAERGHPNPVCALTTCLQQSWRVAPMIDAETACTRLQLAYRHRLLATDDERINAYLHSGVSRREAVRCLAFLPPNTLLETLFSSPLR
jgi:hypothetical protein